MLKPQAFGRKSPAVTRERGAAARGRSLWKYLSLALLIVALGEALVIVRLIHRQRDGSSSSSSSSSSSPLPCAQPGTAPAATVLLSGRAPEPIEGVAVTLWLGSPRWFQNRYSMMLALVHAWLPANWRIQVFYNPRKEMALQATRFEGVKKLVAKGVVILTPLPDELVKLKRKDILVSRWLWDHVAAEKVVGFGGTSVICGNSPHSLADFSRAVDYVGGPWNAFEGLGGDAGLTYRNRTFMRATAEGLATETGLTRRDSGKEDTEIVSLWHDALVMNRSIPFRLASRIDTQRWAMSDGNDAEAMPFGAIGTLAGLTEPQRLKAIDYCPELKLFYPVLSHPSCFGAAPKPVECFKALCETGGLKCEPGAKAEVAPRAGGKGGKKQPVTITFS